MPGPTVLLVVVLALALPGVVPASEQLVAPNQKGAVVNQLAHSGNACGPAALLTSFTLGAERWQEIPRELPGANDRARLAHVIGHYGSRPSGHLAKRPRWQRNNGMSLVDLADVANEMRGERRLPELEWEIVLPQKRESVHELLRRTHGRLARSLRRGLPPVVGVQRLAQRGEGDHQTWATVYGHFIVVTALPRKLEHNAFSIPITYADPWGGKSRTGTLRMIDNYGLTAVVADLPDSKVGSRYVRKGERTVVILSSVLGDF